MTEGNSEPSIERTHYQGRPKTVYREHDNQQRKKEAKMNSVKIALAAMAAGALAGVLFAPAKGSVTRRRISHQATTYAGEIKNSFEDLADSVTQTFETVKGDVESFRKQMIH
jgi:hypothetical protein